MKRLIVAACLAVSLTACGSAGGPVQCPDISSVATPAIGGAGFVTGLTGRLAGPDRENTINEAIAQMRRLDPKLGRDVITDILISADCPNAVARPDHSADANRARIAAFRAQVDQLLTQ